MASKRGGMGTKFMCVIVLCLVCSGTSSSVDVQQEHALLGTGNMMMNSSAGGGMEASAAGGTSEGAKGVSAVAKLEVVGRKKGKWGGNRKHKHKHSSGMSCTSISWILAVGSILVTLSLQRGIIA